LPAPTLNTLDINIRQFVESIGPANKTKHADKINPVNITDSIDTIKFLTVSSIPTELGQSTKLITGKIMFQTIPDMPTEPSLSPETINTRDDPK